ncbi:MAG TPA: ABC transporter permease [Gemmatimonadaceae bacterium]|nr:ABC transporter permease [Gemmatimonadaceae bacterium]
MPKRGVKRYLSLPRSWRRVQSDVDAEIAFEIDMRARDLVSQGVSQEEAQRRALAEFGDVEGTRRYCAEVDARIEASERRASALADLSGDLAHAVRGMRRNAAFALVVLATLALGIGVNTTVFSVVRRILIAPLPYRDPQQLVRIYTTPSANRDDDKVSALELRELATASHALSSVTAFGSLGLAVYDDGQAAVGWSSAVVGPNFFDLLGVKAALGRGVTEIDVADGARPVVVISDSLWRSAFGADSSVLGKVVTLDSRDYTVVGVMPANFISPTFRADVWKPLNLDVMLRNPQSSLAPIWRGIARVRPGVSPSALASELGLLHARMSAEYPVLAKVGVMRGVPLRDAMVGRAGSVLLIVMAAALVVLVATCVNVAGLFLSRAAARRHELAVRAALGAGRLRLVRQLLTESALYGVAGGVAGVLVAYATKNVFVRLTATMLPAMGSIRIDGPVLGFAAMIALSSGVAFGILPAFAATRLDLKDSLGESGGRSASSGRSRARKGRVLVAAQMALAIVLMVGAGLLLRTFVRLMETDVGYSTDSRVLNFGIWGASRRYPDRNARIAVLRGLIARFQLLPGVQAAGYTPVAAWQGGWMSVPLHIKGRTEDAASVPSVQYATATEGYFAAAGIPVLYGRAFRADDRAGAPPVAVISASVAQRFWPNGGALGARIRVGTRAQPDSSADVREIVGVVGDVRQKVTEDVSPTVYVPEWQDFGGGGELAVRVASGDAAALLPAIRRVVHEADPLIPVLFPRTAREVLHDSIAQQQVAMVLMATFALLALTLASLGVYGVTSYSVTARTREFGIRSALGAQRSSVVLLVMGQGLTTTLAGIFAGLTLAAMISRVLQNLLVGVSSHDALTFITAPVLLTCVAIAACLLPARAATSVQPVEALRTE